MQATKTLLPVLIYEFMLGEAAPCLFFFSANQQQQYNSRAGNVVPPQNMAQPTQRRTLLLPFEPLPMHPSGRRTYRSETPYFPPKDPLFSLLSLCLLRRGALSSLEEFWGPSAD